MPTLPNRLLRFVLYGVTIPKLPLRFSVASRQCDIYLVYIRYTSYLVLVPYKNNFVDPRQAKYHWPTEMNMGCYIDKSVHFYLSIFKNKNIISFRVACDIYVVCLMFQKWKESNFKKTQSQPYLSCIHPRLSGGKSRCTGSTGSKNIPLWWVLL